MAKRKYETPEELRAAVNAFLTRIPTVEKALQRRAEEGMIYLPTMEEMIYRLGFRSRQSLANYEKRGDAYADVIRMARSRIMEYQLGLVSAGILRSTTIRRRPEVMNQERTNGQDD